MCVGSERRQKWEENGRGMKRRKRKGGGSMVSGSLSHGFRLSLWKQKEKRKPPIHDTIKNIPFLRRMRRILEPVTKRVWATPCWSRRMTPIWDGVRPLRASFMMRSVTSAVVSFIHAGGVRLKGRAEADMPFPLLCIRPMVDTVCGCEAERGGRRW